ncbi:MAG: two-component system sensor histidine kinase NtrB [Terriglobales bacterium]|jgi:two-component system, sporulation sensor kinase E
MDPIPSLRQVETAELLDSMPEAVFLVDTDSRIRALNQAAEQFAGRAALELCGTHIHVLGQALGLEQNGHEPDCSLGVRRALRGEIVRQQPGVFSRTGGKNRVHATVSASPIRDSQREGETIGALVIVRDVTELTELRDVVSDAERHLAAGQMAAVMAHDFSNVLNSITQAATLLDIKQEASLSERQPYVGMIRNAANRGVEIIQRLRESIVGSKGETSEITADELLEEGLELARPLWSRIQGLSVERRYHSGKVPLCVNAADVRRALVNLIINAIQAMPNGGKLTLSSSIKEHGALLSVEDTGHGIPDDVRAQIFSPYFTTKKGGTGLGLSGARRIINAQGGRIFFVSQAGAGTKFCVELPIANDQKRKKSA